MSTRLPKEQGCSTGAHKESLRLATQQRQGYIAAERREERDNALNMRRERSPPVEPPSEQLNVQAGPSQTTRGRALAHSE